MPPPTTLQVSVAAETAAAEDATEDAALAGASEDAAFGEVPKSALFLRRSPGVGPKMRKIPKQNFSKYFRFRTGAKEWIV